MPRPVGACRRTEPLPAVSHEERPPTRRLLADADLLLIRQGHSHAQVGDADKVARGQAQPPRSGLRVGFASERAVEDVGGRLVKCPSVVQPVGRIVACAEHDAAVVRIDQPVLGREDVASPGDHEIAAGVADRNFAVLGDDEPLP